MARHLLSVAALMLSLATAASAQSPKFHVFLLIGQSNMEGVPLPQAIDNVTDPRILALAYNNCTWTVPAHTYGQWYLAKPPLHSCYLGVGPGDYFAKTLLPNLPAGDSIGLVPCAIAGVDIDFFRKGIVSARRSQFTIPPDNLDSSAYDFVLRRARMAQQRGVIDGIIFHQGESDVGSPTWLTKVKEMVTDLRTDLSLPNLPFVAGELAYDGCRSTHNSIIAHIPDTISNSAVVSAALDSSIYWSSGVPGLGLYQTDHLNAHFNLEAQRELGRRYAEKMMPLLPAGMVMAKGVASKGHAELEILQTSQDIRVVGAPAGGNMSLLRMDGKEAASSIGPSMSTKDLPEGLYMLRARSRAGTVASRLVDVEK